MFSYPARLTKVGAGYVVSFRDIPEALTEGSSKEEALEWASDALTSAMDFYFQDRREVPMPSKAKKGEEEVPLSTSVAAKVLLLNEMLRENVTPAILAKRLQTSPQAVTRIVDLHHSTKIDTIAEAFSAMGKTLVLSVA
ncbi:type II toxin-antitoxin system HicB family antitoxin [Xanthomonas euvesicatoria]|uniref:type II toxin-antitoxin system HicB family antitoxin n=1 Tax=Xanthomonas euvesicatoria TaxID=456327 RepID=UPI001C44C0AD|nr:type II toxin-antitoxin system HicB family antitoxin [Xanthomonas euvesicatoria]MBV6794299.1 type II toxin-antitoxin system HicB family antitoxin [Xanthomonas campestris pv. daturae]